MAFSEPFLLFQLCLNSILHEGNLLGDFFLILVVLSDRFLALTDLLGEECLSRLQLLVPLLQPCQHAINLVRLNITAKSTLNLKFLTSLVEFSLE